MEYTSKQKNYDSDFSGLVQRKIFPDSPVNVNSWEKLNLVPKIRLQNILPAKTIRKDLQGIENILNRTQEFVKENEASEDQKQAKRLQERLFTIKRHNFCAQLEEKAGIWKVREESMNNGVFGKVKSYQVPKRIQQLSLPRKVHQGNTMERSDFRGLLNVDFREAVGKIAKEVSIDKIKKNKKEKFDLNEVQEAIFEINDFEKKFHIKSLTIS